MIREDIHEGDILWAWNTCRAGTVVHPPTEDGSVSLKNDQGEYFTEPYYALMPRPAYMNKPIEGDT